jgi:hypothetical protein
MSETKREPLEKLKFDFAADGGYGRSVRTQHQSTSLFQDLHPDVRSMEGPNDRHARELAACRRAQLVEPPQKAAAAKIGRPPDPAIL